MPLTKTICKRGKKTQKTWRLPRSRLGERRRGQDEEGALPHKQRRRDLSQTPETIRQLKKVCLHKPFRKSKRPPAATVLGKCLAFLHLSRIPPGPFYSPGVKNLPSFFTQADTCSHRVPLFSVPT